MSRNEKPGIGNIRVLQDTGIRKICIISYQLNEKEKISRLKRELEENGFRVSLAGRMNGLMRRFIRIRLSERMTLPHAVARRLRYLWLATGRTLRHGPEDGSALYLLLNGLRTGDGWLHEAAQCMLQGKGLSDHLFFLDERENRIRKYRKPVIGYLEYEVCRHCNLKCKGCSHYSNLVRKPDFADADHFRKNLLRLRELFDNIEVLRLIGGEPFLNRNIGQFVSAAKEIFPDTYVCIVSNGLLIPGLGDEVLESVRAGGASVQISNYPPTAAMAGKIAQRLKDAGIRYGISAPIRSFQFESGAEAGNAEQNYLHCCMSQDHSLTDDGRLCQCYQPIVYEASKDVLKTKREVSAEDWIDIRQEDDGYEILRRMHGPNPFCRYCITGKKIMFPWKGGFTEELTEDTARDR